MPGFDPTILRDEEKLGGFEPNTGDETFLLEQLPSYPGGQQPDAVANTVGEAPVAEATPDVEPDVAFSVEDSAMAMTDVDEYSRVPDEPMDTIAASDETSQATYNDPLVLDDSLIALLKADLADSKKRKEKEVVPPVDTTPSFAAFSAEDRSGDIDDAGVELDLASIDADHPSTYGIDRSMPPNQPDKPPVAPKEEPHEPKKKRRKFFPWPLVAGAGLLLLLLLGAAAYFYFVPTGLHKTTVLHDSSAVSEYHEHTATATHDSQVTHGTEEHGAHNTHVHVDTSAHGSAAMHDTVSESTHGTNQDLSGRGTTPADHSAKSNQTAAVEPSSNHSAHPENEGQKKVPVSSPAVIAKEPVVHNRSTAAKESPVKMETKPERRPYKPQSPPSASAQGEYVIQVYASPSADDADEWLQQLRKRSINDGFISSQSVRGQTWYRVRFGKFATRDEADTRASQLGFSNVWVVRVK